MTDSSVTSLQVNLGDRSYDIVIGEAITAIANKYILPLLPIPNAIIVTDDTVSELYLEPLTNALQKSNVEVTYFILPAGESTKSFSMLEELLEDILSHQPERNTTLIALGGGVIGDLTGFTASILLRGVPFIQIPTTLLAQVDSSVGGKTGINSSHGKNLIGSFYQPQLVLADIGALRSLSDRDFLSGYAEVVKYALIRDPEFFSWLEENHEAILDRDSHALTHCVKTSCQHKADIVAQDEKEGGVRALLNLGHTFGHALEKATGFSALLLHGEAVSIGMVMAFAYSVRQGFCPKEDLTRIKNHFKVMGLPTSPCNIQSQWNIDILIDAMAHDKKVSQGKLVFILAKGIGQSYIAKEVDPESIRHFLHAFLG